MLKLWICACDFPCLVMSCLFPAKQLEWAFTETDLDINGSLSCGTKSEHPAVLAMQEV